MPSDVFSKCFESIVLDSQVSGRSLTLFLEVARTPFVRKRHHIIYCKIILLPKYTINREKEGLCNKMGP